MQTCEQVYTCISENVWNLAAIQKSGYIKTLLKF